MIGGRPSRDYRLSSIVIDPIWDEALFRPPADRVAIQRPPPAPALRPLGQDVYAILGPYNVMFAVFRDYVLLAEAPLDAAYAEAYYRLIRSVAPGTPVRVVASHFHYDHIGGLRYAVSQRSPIWGPADARAPIEAALASRRTFRSDQLSASPQSLDFHPVKDSAVFDDGTQRVEIYDMGPTQHAGHMLVVHFARAKTLLVADLWDILSPELALGGIDAEILMHRATRLNLTFDRMVPVHGVPVSRRDMERGLAIRAKYVRPLNVDAWTRGQVPSRPAR